MVRIVVEDIDTEKGVLVDFADEKSFEEFLASHNLDKNSEDASMLLFTNASAEGIELYTQYELDEKQIQTVEYYVDSAPVNDSSSVIIGYKSAYKGKLKDIFQITDYKVNEPKERYENNFDLSQTINENDLWINVRNVGQANWNEIHSGNKLVVVYDVGLPIYAKKDDVSKMISDVEKDYQKDNPILVISHWDIDHYHALKYWLKVSQKFPFSSMFYISELPNVTAKRIIEKLQKNYSNILLNPICVQCNKNLPNLKKIASISNKIRFYAPNTFQSNDRNSSEIVVVAENQFGSAILPGDSHYEQLTDILSEIKTTENHNLVVPHHGGDDMFIYNTNGLICNNAVISVGENTYGHPAKNIEADLRKMNFCITQTLFKALLQQSVEDYFKERTQIIKYNDSVKILLSK